MAREHPINMRVSDEERALMARAAAAEALPLVTWIRRAAILRAEEILAKKGER